MPHLAVRRDLVARWVAVSLVAVPVALVSTSAGLAQPASFVAPPRTITDITAILDQEKPDSAFLAKQKAAAEAQPPRDASSAILYRFYLERGYARAELGRQNDAREDGAQAIRIGQQAGLEFNQILSARRFVALQHLNAGEYKRARELLSEIERDLPSPTSKEKGRGPLINLFRWTITALINLGDLPQAEGYRGRLTKLHGESRSWQDRDLYGPGRESEFERAKAELAMAKGQYREAEAAYRQSIAAVRQTIALIPRMPQSFSHTTKEQLENRIDQETASQAMAKANQGRLAEAEADIRRALLSRLKSNGKYSTTTAGIIGRLGIVISQQGRYAEAEKLARQVLEIRRTIGVDPDSEGMVGLLRRLASLAMLQHHYADAAKIQGEIDGIIKGWEPQRRELYELDSARMYSLVVAGRAEEGLAVAQRMLARDAARFGDNHVETQFTRGLLGVALSNAGRNAEALAEFGRSVPSLIATARSTDVDESAVAALRNARVRDIVEAYVALLARVPASQGFDPAGEAFRIIDAVHGRTVQQAVTASAARMVARDQALAQLVRRDQDNEKQISALLGLVNNLLAKPAGERDEKAVQSISADVDKLRAARAQTRAEIARRFSSYAELIDPKPPTVEDIRAVLRPGEALLSFHFGRERSFVWALPKDGAMAFAAITPTSSDVEATIVELRKALEPDPDTKIPDFDLGLAFALYEQILKPVEAGWKGARSLIVVTNGALGLLPLGLLPTARVSPQASDGPVFAAYRKVPWLARTHAVAQVPSAAAFRTLRQLPAGSPSREALIGFGDPFFSEAQASEAVRTATLTQLAAETGIALRRRASPNTGKIDNAELARLPRLPDTADELKAVAEALHTDPARTLHLGKAANEQTVKRTDLTRYRIVAFSTHGLLPGDLNGLTQPALALTAPEVAGIDGDGLLTMDEILALKLDADWVVLSACNTGAGSSSGAEAMSGLGRAFFYAGTRSLLITNWSVDTVSARELVTDLFRRQAADPSLPRSEALRRAMMELVDTGGLMENGRMSYSYAHPLFWAPYSITGEGDGR